MKNYNIFIFFFVVLMLNSCIPDKEPKDDCPFKLLSYNEKEEISTNKFQVDAKSKISSNIKKLVDVDAEIFGSLKIEDFNSYSESIKYSPEIIDKHNVIINALCIKYSFYIKVDSSESVKKELNAQINNYLKLVCPPLVPETPNLDLLKGNISNLYNELDNIRNCNPLLSELYKEALNGYTNYLNDSLSDNKSEQEIELLIISNNIDTLINEKNKTIALCND